MIDRLPQEGDMQIEHYNRGDMVYYAYKGGNGATVGGSQEFIDLWIENERKRAEEKKLWIEELRSKGIKAAHPNDGWVDRINNTVKFAYPQFNDGVEIGDLIALGTSYEDIRIVKVINIETSMIGEIICYWFEDLPKPKVKTWWKFWEKA